jgi:hypothetical protein
MKLTEQVVPHQLFKIELTADEAAGLRTSLQCANEERGLDLDSERLLRFLQERLDR